MRHPRRVFGYVRVSGAEQGRSGTSLEGQREEIERHCAARGFPAPRIVLEVASAGREKLEQRVELRAMLHELVAGDLVVVTKVDRWSRDIAWGVQSVRDLVARGVGWMSIGESLDATTAQGDSTLGIMSWVADQERARIRERTVGRRKELRDLGLYVEGRAPVGYERHARRLRVVEADAAIVRQVYAWSIGGASVGQIVAQLRAEHPSRHGWDHKTIGRMLRSRIYLGEVETSRGAWVASHDPIVERAVWERAQRALDARRLGGRHPSADARTASWLLRGLATCATCGARMGAAYSNHQRSGGYYACRGRLRGACDAGYVSVAAADAAAGVAALARLGELRDELAVAPAAPLAPATDYATKRARLAARRERTIDLGADGAIGRDEVRARLATIDAQLGQLELEAGDEARARELRRPGARAELLRHVDGLARAWRRATVAERRGVLQRLAEAVRLRAGGEPAIAWRPAEELHQETGGLHLSKPTVR